MSDEIQQELNRTKTEIDRMIRGLERNMLDTGLSDKGIILECWHIVQTYRELDL